MNKALFGLFKRFAGLFLPAFTGLVAGYNFKFTVQTLAADGTVDPTLGSVILVDNSAGNRALLLPLATGNVIGQELTFQRITATANTCTIGRSGSDTIDGGTSAKSLAAQWKSITLVAASSGSWITQGAT